MDCILLSGLRTRPGSAVQAARIAAVFPYSEPFATAIRFVIGKKTPDLDPKSVRKMVTDPFSLGAF